MTKKLSYKHYGLTVYVLDSGEEWAVGDDTKRDEKGRTRVDRAVRRAIIENLWAFRASFLVSFLERHTKHFKHVDSDKLVASLTKMQQELCEDAQGIVRAMVGSHLSALVDEAVRSDGRGHSLSGYDGAEVRSDDVEGLPKGKIAFRIN